MSKDNNKSSYQVPNLERALKIMEFLSKDTKKSTMAEITRSLSYPNNSVFRIVSTLEKEGYLLKNEDTKEFSLSRKLLSLGYKSLVETNLIASSMDILRLLRDSTRETALLGIILDGEGVVLEQELSPEPIKFMVSPGSHFLLHTAAPGKAIMAYLDKKELERQITLINFTPFNSHTISTPDEYKAELKKVRVKGFSVDHGEEAEGIICIGAPIFDYRGRPKAAIWITGPQFRLSPEKISQTGEIVKRHAMLLSKRMGYQE